MTHKARRRFGQHFLHDTSYIDALMQQISPESEDKVIEIGPGLGALTEPLMKHLSHLTVIEIDNDLIHHLKKTFPHSLSILHADVLSIDFTSLGDHLRIVGNLPYNISTPILFHLLHANKHLKDIHVMLQKEVVDRIAASPGNKAYGRLSVMMQYVFETTYLFDVPPSAFSPPPKVNSAVLRLVPYTHSPYPSVPFNVLEYIVAKAFATRRKTLSNNFKSIITTQELNTLDIQPSLRAEQLSIAEFVKLSQCFEQKGILCSKKDGMPTK